MYKMLRLLLLIGYTLAQIPFVTPLKLIATFDQSILHNSNQFNFDLI